MKTIINKILPFFLALTSLFFILVESQFKNLTESVSAPWQMYFHNPETPVMEGIINFHDKAMCLITFIVFAVGYILFRCVVLFENKNDNRLSEKFIHGTAIEIIWTILPALTLLNLAVPSFALLYSMDELPTPQGTLKCVGHQWYWTYEYSDSYNKNPVIGGLIKTQEFERTPSNINKNPTISDSDDSISGDVNLLTRFNSIDEKGALISNRWGWDSSIKNSLVSVTSFERAPNEESLPFFQEFETESYLVNEAVDFEYHRLLSVDNSAKVPARRHIRILITSADVLHSWCVPSLGIKVDACPGRLNQTSTYLNRAGVKHYGQCSEICGVNHGFMPIVLESFFDTKREDYVDISLTNRYYS
jgi:heme/copper-type cytochrome/quinol oxidase subunit 2